MDTAALIATRIRTISGSLQGRGLRVGSRPNKRSGSARIISATPGRAPASLMSGP